METAPVKLDKKEVFLALTDPLTLATTLHSILIVTYGPDIYEVDATELFLRLEEDFGAQPSEEVENRIQAIILAVSTDSFYNDPDAFTAICESLCNGDPGLEGLEALTLAEVVWGVYEVELNHEGATMSPQVHKLVQQAIDSEAEEAGDYQYMMNFLHEQRERLEHQLRKVGFKEFHLPAIKG